MIHFNETVNELNDVPTELLIVMLTAILLISTGTIFQGKTGKRILIQGLNLELFKIGKVHVTCDIVILIKKKKNLLHTEEINEILYLS